jgi:hypothetical protein
MFKTSTIGIPLAIAMLVLGVVAAMPVYAQQVLLQARPPGAVTAGDWVTLTANVRGLNRSVPWNLQIWETAPARRLLANCGAVTTCRFRARSTAGGAYTFEAILNQPPQVVRPRYSNQVTVGWAYATPVQLVMTVQGTRVVVPLTFQNDGSITVGNSIPPRKSFTASAPGPNWTNPVR